MELQPKHVVLTVKNVDKPDEGPYKVTMQNQFGKDDAEIKTEVKGIVQIVVGLFMNIYHLIWRYRTYYWQSRERI